MATGIGYVVGIFVATLFASGPSRAEDPDGPGLRARHAMITLDYQVVKVANDASIDLMGVHLHHQVVDGLYVGAGLYAPLFKGAYGGFTAYDIGVHAQPRLTANVFATAGLSAGGGAGGRSVDQARALSGSGSFYKAYVGLGYDFGAYAVGLNVTKMKFRGSPIDGTQANVFLEIPYTYFAGPFASHGDPLSASDAERAAQTSRETMITLAFDNFRQRDPQGTSKDDFNIVDLQYSRFFERDTYWFADLGVGYRGLPLSNQIFGGIGQRVQLSPRVALYGQLGIGSGIYAPEVIDTASGLLVYPKVSAEYAVTRDVGVSLSAGYLVAPRGTSKNAAVGLAVTRHFRGAEGGGSPAYQGYRVSLFHETETSIRYRDLDRGTLKLIGIQADAIVDDRWYIPLQAAIAYGTYLGYPGYGELLVGLGLQSRAGRDDRWQAFGQVLAGTNVHGLTVKGSGGARYLLNDALGLHLEVGRTEARSSAGNRFSANSVGLGVDYRFSMPAW